MSVFRVGMKVAATIDMACGIAKGQVFTIASIHHGQFEAFDGARVVVALLFKEVSPREEYCAFDSRFFRHVVDRKTDISIFTRMLNTIPQTAGAKC